MVRTPSIQVHFSLMYGVNPLGTQKFGAYNSELTFYFFIIIITWVSSFGLKRDQLCYNQ